MILRAFLFTLIKYYLRFSIPSSQKDINLVGYGVLDVPFNESILPVGTFHWSYAFTCVHYKRREQSLPYVTHLHSLPLTPGEVARFGVTERANTPGDLLIPFACIYYSSLFLIISR